MLYATFICITISKNCSNSYFYFRPHERCLFVWNKICIHAYLIQVYAFKNLWNTFQVVVCKSLRCELHENKRTCIKIKQLLKMFEHCIWRYIKFRIIHCRIFSAEQSQLKRFTCTKFELKFWNQIVFSSLFDSSQLFVKALQ